MQTAAMLSHPALLQHSIRSAGCRKRIRCGAMACFAMLALAGRSASLFMSWPTFPWADSSEQKRTLLSLVAGTARGAAEPDGRRKEIIEAFEALEQRNPTAAPVQSELLKGDWELLWTSSESILGSNRPFFLQPLPEKPILQFLDPAEGVARNLEDTMLGRNTVDAEITPLTREGRDKFASKLDNFLFFKYGAEEKAGGTYLPEVELERTTVGVRFKKFTILGLLAITAPEQATGILEVTYLDDELRLSRGDRGNLFVLRKVASERSA